VGLGGFDEFEGHRRAGGAGAGSVSTSRSSTMSTTALGHFAPYDVANTVARFFHRHLRRSGG
jgi:hypothetical protein